MFSIILQLANKVSNQHQKELEDIRTGRARLGFSYMQTLSAQNELEKLPLHTLKALQTQLKQDLHTLEKVSLYENLINFFIFYKFF